jgi:hypothetical protein
LQLFCCSLCQRRMLSGWWHSVPHLQPSIVFDVQVIEGE